MKQGNSGGVALSENMKIAGINIAGSFTLLGHYKIPSTNNPIERVIRSVKIKQKIGKFRSKNGADVYAEK